MNIACKICGNTDKNTWYVAREMMLGFRDEFDYFQCSNCQCLQAKEIPEKLEKYYPKNYYSFSKPSFPKQSRFKCFLKRQRTRRYLRDKNIIGSMLLKLFGEPGLPNWVHVAKHSVDSRILDVGCGSGKLLIRLQNEGYTHLTGLDPYIKENCKYENGINIHKKQLSDLNESFDFIMFHHSFEHLHDPVSIFNELHKKLNRNGRVLIRIPVVSSFAWHKYKTNWIQLDAPRHLFLHSIKSIELLSKHAGFEVESIEYDSSIFQFWGSEQYSQDIPMYATNSYINGIDNSIFTNQEIKEFRLKATELNSAKQGDQACFVLRKITVPTTS